jgi:hypothetical protein
VTFTASELRSLRSIAETAVYSSARQEVAIRADGLEGALALADAIVAARRAEHEGPPVPVRFSSPA